MIKFTINGLPKLPNQLLRKHWSVIMKEGRRWRAFTRLAVGYQIPPKPFALVKVTLTRHSVRQPDFDGLVGSFKYVLDGLVKAGVMVDDKASVIVESKYAWQKSKLIDQRIEITVEKVS